MRTFYGLAVAVFAASLGCEGAPSIILGGAPNEIIGGELDEAHDGVVVVATDGAPTCSGALIDPRIVLTTPNCISEDGSNSVLFGANFFEPESSVGIVDVVVHPDCDIEDLTTPHLAVGVLMQDAPAGTTTYAILPESAPLSSDDVGSTVTFVGHGSTSATMTVDGQRRWVDAPITDVSAGHFTVDSTNGGPCWGDGPSFVEREGAEHLAGVGLFTDQDCAEYWTSVDLSAHREFVEEMIAEFGSSDSDSDSDGDTDSDTDADADSDGGTPTDGGDDGDDTSGCDCRVVSGSMDSMRLPWFALLGRVLIR